MKPDAAKMAELVLMIDFEDAYYSIVSPSSTSSTSSCIHPILAADHIFHFSPLPDHYLLSASTVFRLCPQIRACSLRCYSSRSPQPLCRLSSEHARSFSSSSFAYSILPVLSAHLFTILGYGRGAMLPSFAFSASCVNCIAVSTVLGPCPRMQEFTICQGSKFSLCRKEKQRKDFEIHDSIHVDCLRSMSMDAKSHPSSFITLSLLDPCSLGMCREHVHKQDVTLLDGVMQGRT